MDRIRTVYADIPHNIGGYTIKNADDDYTIVLNSHLSYDRNVESFIHELNHISNRDYDKNNSASSIELQMKG